MPFIRLGRFQPTSVNVPSHSTKLGHSVQISRRSASVVAGILKISSVRDMNRRNPEPPGRQLLFSKLPRLGSTCSRLFNSLGFYFVCRVMYLLFTERSKSVFVFGVRSYFYTCRSSNRRGLVVCTQVFLYVFIAVYRPLHQTCVVGIHL